MDLTQHLPNPNVGQDTAAIPTELQQKQPPKRLPVREMAVGVLLLGFVAASTFAATKLVQQPQDIRERAAEVSPAPTPTPANVGQCVAVKIFIKDVSGNYQETPWGELYGKISLNDTVRLAVNGTANAFQKAHFRVNNGDWQETTIKDASGNYTYDYQVTTNGSFKVDAELLTK